MEAPEQLQPMVFHRNRQNDQSLEFKRQCVEAGTVMKTDARNARVASQLWRTPWTVLLLYLNTVKVVMHPQAHVSVLTNPCIGS